MKNLIYLSMGLLAAATLSACSSSDDVAGDNNPGVTNAVKAYINVNIVSNSTRADDEPYEDGTGAENAVGTTRFYFFDDNKNAYVVNDGKSYIDYNQSYADNSGSSSEHIEKSASIAIDILHSGVYPKYLVAVLNPPTDKTSKTALETNINYDNLQAHLLKTSTAKSTSNFVMSNSVYANSSNAVVDATKLETNVFYATAAEANAENANAVNVYVERAMAKVTTTISKKAESNGTYSLSGDQTKLGDDQVYAKILGWKLTSTANESYLVKSIDQSWTTTAPTGFNESKPWNDPTFHRSFWAQTPAQSEKYTYNNNKLTLTEKGASEYCLENTEYTTSGSNVVPFSSTKVIVYAQLQDASGNALSIVRWKGVNYKETDFKSIIASGATSIKMKEKSETSTWSDLTASDIALRYNYASLGTHQEAYKAIPTIANDKRSYVFQINGQKVEANKDASGNVTKSVIQKVEEALKDYTCNLYANGNTYYYEDVKHLNEVAAVVRNHVYKVDITGIEGLGTPIVDKEHDDIDDPTDPNSPEKDNYPDIPTDPYPEDGGGDGKDPEPIIIPERPNDTKAYIKAKINVLSWRIVTNSSVTLK